MSRQRALPLLVLVAASCCASLLLSSTLSLEHAFKAAWLTPGLDRAKGGQLRLRVARAATGFGTSAKAKDRRKRKKVDEEQLKIDHGEKASAVERALRGDGAELPEDMVRARFSACRTKDALFMARTEVNDDRSLEKRARGWAVTFGEEDKKDWEPDPGAGEKLRKIKRFELIEAEDNEVEFKIHCEGGILHERSIMEEDEKWGWVYSGKSKFDKWEA
eukprot:TRINITY_DN3477_c0_g1_i1.p1 TRINITY_DN3477_c0_g1~~TRINITY_DN3477_c0_g1_i1.p1  ORF type:complete len:218 (-),score=60.19 TRINITY_DN3477_c0_g1_i1:198-851(-)